jgi:hypothetical protein
MSPYMGQSNMSSTGVAVKFATMVARAFRLIKSNGA